MRQIKSDFSDIPHQPPAARIEPIRETIHGVEVEDPYRWLEDKGAQEVCAWAEAQHAYTRAVLDALPWREELIRRELEPCVSDRNRIPTERAGRLFYVHYPADRREECLVVREGLHGPERVLVQPPEGSAWGGGPVVSYRDISPDGKLVAYEFETYFGTSPEIRLLDVDTGQELSDRLPVVMYRTYTSVCLHPNKCALYYSYRADAGEEVACHVIGTDPSGDSIVFSAGLLGENPTDDEFARGRPPDKPMYSTRIFLNLSEDGRYLALVVAYHRLMPTEVDHRPKRSDVYYQDLEEQGPIRPLITGVAARFQSHVAEHHLFLQTDWDAPNERIIAIDLKRPEPEHWCEVVAEGRGHIHSAHPVAGKLLVKTFEDLSCRLTVYEPDGRLAREIRLPALGNVSWVTGSWVSPSVFLTFCSFHVPSTVYRCDIETGGLEAWTRRAVPVVSDRLEVSHVWFASRDGTQVSMFLVHARGLEPDGATPVLLVPKSGLHGEQWAGPAFLSEAVLWAESGGVYAQVNLRGCSGLGKAWEQAALREKKQDAIDDFIAAAEWMIARRYTNHTRLAIAECASGCTDDPLIGAAVTQRPDLIRAAVWCHPMADMVRFLQNLPVHLVGMRRETVLYGSPQDSLTFAHLYAYSPYHHVQPDARYPAVLMKADAGANLRLPQHTLKMAARLQAVAQSDQPALLIWEPAHVEGEIYDPKRKRASELADRLAFLFWQLGMIPVVQGTQPLPE